MEATAGDFIKFATDWHFNKDTQVSISRENHDIYRLLTVMRNGYMNIHEQPFTYFNELLPYAKEFEKVTQVKSAKMNGISESRPLNPDSVRAMGISTLRLPM